MGVGLGIASRLVDTAAGAPEWIGLVLSPWLAAPWLAGAWIAREDASLEWGAVAGLVLMSATVATYLAMAGADAPSLVPDLPLLALVAGIGFGAIGAGLHHGARGRLVAAIALGATFAIEGLLLQWQATEVPLARTLFVAEAAAGVLVATWIAGWRAGVGVLVIGAVVLGIESAILATIGPTLGRAGY